MKEELGQGEVKIKLSDMCDEAMNFSPHMKHSTHLYPTSPGVGDVRRKFVET